MTIGAQEREPAFWTWEDVALSAGLYLPSVLIAFLLFRALPIALPTKAAQALAPQFFASLIWFGGLYGMLWMRYQRPLLRAFGWSIPRGPGIALSLFGGPILAIFVSILGLILKTPDVQNPIKDWLNDPASLALTAVFAVLLAPLFEEMMFRGFILPLAIRSLGVAAGIVMTAIPFALMHGPQYGWSWRHLLLLAAAGSAFGWIRHFTGSTAAALITHSAYNLTFLAAYLSQS
jgi:membrane protease YdiL (CAAX protease family)